MKLSKGRKRPIALKNESSSFTPPSPCPWWNGSSNGGVLNKHKCNVYGLYQYIMSLKHESNAMDLSFWPINDADVQKLMKMVVMDESSRRTGEEVEAKKCAESKMKKNNLRHIKQLRLHSCMYLTDYSIWLLATNWNYRGNGIIYKNDMNHGKNSDAETEDNEDIFPSLQISINRRYPYFNSQLLHLDVSNCYCITNLSCKCIGLQFSKLESLNISNCLKITDQGLLHIMQGCKYLNAIYLRNLIHLQDEGLSYIRRNLILMKSLRIIG